MFNSMQNRYMVIRLILDNSTFPSSSTNIRSSNIKVIRSDNTPNTLAVEATITKAGGFMANHAQVTIYGMLKDDIDAFTRFRRNVTDPFAQNWIEIYAGYELDNLNMPPFVYRGQVVFAYPDYNDTNRPFTITSQSGVFDATNPVNSYSIRGNVSYDTILRNIISQNSFYTYVPNGDLSGTIENPYFYGSLDQQISDLCLHHGLHYKIDGNQVLVAPKNVPFNKNVFIINASTGMIGYPTGDDTGFNVKTWFNPAIQFGQYITLESYNKYANGNWYINGLQHTLQTKNDNWVSNLKLNAYTTSGIPYSG